MKDETRAVKRKLEDDMDMSHQLDKAVTTFWWREPIV